MIKFNTPNKNNSCGGAYLDWLEINLLKECNACCKWCIELKGYHPKQVVSYAKIAEAALKTEAKNIILLGGEPTLYKDLNKLIKILTLEKRNVWITTNGKLLTRNFVKENLQNICGVNISIHHYNLDKNAEIIGLKLKRFNLFQAVTELLDKGVKIRLNCNCIKDYIDSEVEMMKYIEFAKSIGVYSVRFAELKGSKEFVNIAKMVNYRYGTSEEPFIKGCSLNGVISGVSVNFRLMCGLQTSYRKRIKRPKQHKNKVLYYDGKIYDGWQVPAKEEKLYELTSEELEKLLQDVRNKKISIEKARIKIQDTIETARDCTPGTTGCAY